jgi:ribosomal protein S18 acetylase RimI-like enzyme
METAPYTVRRARETDMAQVGRLAAELVRAHRQLDPERFMAFPEPIEPRYQFYLTKEIQNPEAVLLVAVGPAPAPGSALAGGAEERVLGYAWGQVRGTDYMAMLQAGGVVQDLFVAPEARRKGVAGALVRAVAAELRGLGARRIVLHTAALNQAARAFFAGVGFRMTMVEMMLPCEQDPGPEGLGVKRDNV